MINDHERGRMSAARDVAPLHIVTVCVRGRDTYPMPRMSKRILLLDRLIEALAQQSTWPEVDAILLPGGFFRLAAPIGRHSPADRRAMLMTQDAGLGGAAASRLLDRRWPGVTLIVGIDSEPIDTSLAGDQLVAAWQHGELVGLARKAFPVASETRGEDPVFWANLDDADEPGRIVTLRHGQRALLLACYDAFAVRALHGSRFAALSALRLVSDAKGRIRPLRQAERQEHLRRWLAMLQVSPPDLGLIAIHEFDRPGRDGYWQRHGIAGASAALDGAPILAAAHFRRNLPASFASSSLAARQVPLLHLEQGQRRLAHRLIPHDGFVLPGGNAKSSLLVRLFILDAQRNIS
ncbi:hypothetical protein [Bosea sp. NPDC055594]